MRRIHVALAGLAILLESPIVKNKTSFIVSGRRTWIDVLARSLISVRTKGRKTQGYYFYDFNAKVNHHFFRVLRQWKKLPIRAASSGRPLSAFFAAIAESFSASLLLG